MTLQELKNSVYNYSNRINSTWSDNDEVSSKSIQRRIAYAQSQGSLMTSHSYWLLTSNNQFSDAKILLRVLTERLANAFYAKKSPKKGCELAALELHEELKITERWKSYYEEKGKDISPALKKINDLQDEIRMIEGYLDNKEYKKIKPWVKFLESDLEFIHKGSFADYCQYAHPTTTSGFSHEPNSILDNYLALLIPVECSFAFHQVICVDEESCTEFDKYKTVTEPISAYFRENTGTGI